MPLPFINFHTHNVSPIHAGKIAVNSYGINEFDSINLDNYFTLGIHPWDADAEQLDKHLAKIISYSSNPKMIGFGEIGLDKINGPSINIQQYVFLKQVQVAYDINKPIIIHCVKAWDALLATKANFYDTALWAIHGFNGSPQLTKQLVSKGFYVSVGTSILDEKTKLQNALSTIPLNRLFLETDTSTVDIKEIYKAAAVRLGVSVDSLKQQISSNFTKFYKIEPLWE